MYLTIRNKFLNYDREEKTFAPRNTIDYNIEIIKKSHCDLAKASSWPEKKKKNEIFIRNLSTNRKSTLSSTYLSQIHEFGNDFFVLATIFGVMFQDEIFERFLEINFFGFF